MPVSTSTPGRHVPLALLAVTLLVFAIVVAYVGLWLRSGLREQILRREAGVLTEVASLQLRNEADLAAPLGVKDDTGELLNAVLKTSKLRGVFAVRVFDEKRRYIRGVPFDWSESAPPPEYWADLVSGMPVVRLHARESAAEVIGLAPSVPDERAEEPLLETWLPLRRGEGDPLLGAAQMWTDGHAVATEFRAVDSRLIKQALLAWLAGAVIISIVLRWAFRRLAEANLELRARRDDLLRANSELALAAKTSALGAITAHLMHELKNPLAGLEEFVASQSGNGERDAHGGELEAATKLTRRLRTMINDVASVMRDEQTGAHFELTAAEILELTAGRAQPLASARGVSLDAGDGGKESVPGRQANLACLVTYNLVQNAIEATPFGGCVRLSTRPTAKGVAILVEDQGPGLPKTVLERLFQPCVSAKPGGSGLGLALSQQLARQAGGRIELVRTDPAGTCFQLVLDLKS